MSQLDEPCGQCGERRGDHRAITLECPLRDLDGRAWVGYNKKSKFRPFPPGEFDIMPGVVRDMGGSGIYQQRGPLPARPGRVKPIPPGGIPIGGQISPRGRPVGQNRDGFRGAPPMPWEDVTVMIQNLRELELHDVAAVLEAEDQERKRLLKAVDNLNLQLASMADALRNINPGYEAMKMIVVKLQQQGVDIKKLVTDPVMVENLLGRKNIDVSTPKAVKQIKETIRTLDFEDDD